jgi:hypothetical protein
VRPEGLDKLKKKIIHFIGSRTRDLLACSRCSAPISSSKRSYDGIYQLRITKTDQELKKNAAFHRYGTGQSRTSQSFISLRVSRTQSEHGNRYIHIVWYPALYLNKTIDTFISFGTHHSIWTRQSIHSYCLIYRITSEQENPYTHIVWYPALYPNKTSDTLVSFGILHCIGTGQSIQSYRLVSALYLNKTIDTFI